MTKRESVRNYPPNLGLVDNLWGHEFLHPYPHELERDIERLRSSIEHPQSERGLTVMEHMIRVFVAEAQVHLRDNGHDPARVSSYSENGLSVPLASARWIILNADRVRKAIEVGSTHDAALLSMELMASAIRMSAFGTVMDGAWKRVERQMGGEARGRERRADNIERDQEIVEQAQKLLKNGRSIHDISSIISDTRGITSKTIRGILQREGIMKKRETR